jgi:peptide/nickel transport system substrate-binding protein
MGGLNPVLDPQVESAGNSNHYKLAVFDALTSVDSKGEVVPALAISWKSLDDKTWEFKLRPGVTFSNGAGFTSKDVVFAIRRILDPSTKSTLVGRIQPMTAEAVDDLTVRVVTKNPDPILLRRVAIILIAQSESFDPAKPLGTGPFKVTEFQREQFLVLERVNTSWRKASVAKITMKLMPELSTRVTSLRTGEIDILHNLSADQIDAVRSAGFDVVTAVSGRTCVLVLISGYTGYSGPLANPTVRRALNYAIDKESMVKNLLHGTGAIARGQLVGPDGFGHNPNLNAYPFDPAKARSLLTEAGYPNGFSLKLMATRGFFQGDIEMAQALAGMLSEVRVTVNLDVLDSAAWVTAVTTGQSRDMVFTCVNYFPAMDADFVLANFESTFPFKWYSNPEFDKGLQKSRTIMDTEQRKQELQRLAQILYESPPVVFLYQEAVTLGASKKVRGLEARADQVIWFDTIRKLR